MTVPAVNLCCRNKVVRAARRRRVRHQRHRVRSLTPTVLNRRQTFSSRRHRALAPAHSSTSQVRQSRQSRQSRHRALTPARSSTSQVRQSRPSSGAHAGTQFNFPGTSVTGVIGRSRRHTVQLPRYVSHVSRVSRVIGRSRQHTVQLPRYVSHVSRVIGRSRRHAVQLPRYTFLASSAASKQRDGVKPWRARSFEAMACCDRCVFVFCYRCK